MSNKLKPRGFGLVFAGLALFFNPYFAAVDILPDFIGCILICLGLSRVAMIHDGMRDAASAFWKLAIVDVLKNLALLIIFGMGSTAEQPSALLMAAFAAAVAELMFLIPAIRKLFDGFLSLSITYDCQELYGSEPGGFSRTERMQRLTVVFLILREVVCLLPEFAALTTSSYSDSAVNRLYDHIGVMRGIACIVVFFVGVYWLIRLLGYNGLLRREEGIVLGVTERCQQHYDTHPGIAVQRRHGACFILLFAGALLLTDFYLDFQNVLPDALGALLLLLGALLPRVERKYRFGAAASILVYGILAAISSNASYDFVSRFNAGQIARNPEAGAAYLKMWILALLEFLAFLVMLLLLLLLLRAVIRQWAGYRPHHASSRQAGEEENGFESRSLLNLWAELDNALIRCFVFGFISGLFSFLYDYIKEMPGKGIYHLLEFTWIFDFCAALVFAFLFGALLHRIYREIKQRFMYD